MLISVLLRRNVSSLGSYSVKNVKLKSEWEVVRLLGEMISPLLNIFVNVCGVGSGENKLPLSKISGIHNIQRQIGFIIAEVCASLSVMEESISIDVMNIVLDQISHGVSYLKKKKEKCHHI